jgi:hypothetical protein
MMSLNAKINFGTSHGSSFNSQRTLNSRGSRVTSQSTSQNTSQNTETSVSSP